LGAPAILATVPSLKSIRRVPQIRQFTEEDVPAEIVDRLLELARWTGSSKNGQPWHFVVVRDRDTLKQLAALRPNINWAAAAPVGIAIVLDGNDQLGEAYDEGRVTERLLTGATLLGYGAGVAWYGEADKQAAAKRILGIPAERTARQIVMIGRPKSREDPRASGPKRGRKPLSELVSSERFGTKRN
jgi:nitroreductase